MANDSDSRERILASAERLFARQGFTGTSVRQILRDAEVSSPMLYYYFGSKHDLLCTLIRDRFDRFRDRAAIEIELASSVEEVFTRFAEVIFDVVRDKPTTFRFLFSILQSTISQIPREDLSHMKLADRRLLAEALEHLRPEVDADRRVFSVFMFHGLLNSLLMMFLSGHQERLDTELARVIGKRAAAVLDDDFPVPVLSPIWKGPTKREEP